MKLNILNGAIVALACVSAVSCSKMNDRHQEYLDKGETIYAARVDSMFVHPGVGRCEIAFYYAAQRIKKGTLTWDDVEAGTKETRSILFDKTPGTEPVLYMIDNMSEADFVFYLVTEDEFGNKSLKDEVSGRVYGDRYIKTLYAMKVASVEGITGNPNGFNLHWGPLETDAYMVEVKYTKMDDTEGVVVFSMIPPKGDSVPEKGVIEDAKPGSEFTYKTSFRPNERMIPEDIIWLDVEYTGHF